MLPFRAAIPILGHVIEHVWSALDALFQRGVCRCLYNNTVTSPRQVEIQPSLDNIGYFHSSITLLIYSHPLNSYYTHPPPSAGFPGFS